jgi:hypothetical protein
MKTAKITLRLNGHVGFGGIAVNGKSVALVLVADRRSPTLACVASRARQAACPTDAADSSGSRGWFPVQM